MTRPDSPEPRPDAINLPPPEWFATGREYHRDRTISELLAQAVERHPDRPALVDDHGVAYTHREMAEAATRTADRLRALGIGRGDFVGVLAGHRPETICGIVGILRAGAAYVPVDPRWPLHRIGEALRRAGAVCLLADGEQARPAFEVTDLVPSVRQVQLLEGAADPWQLGWDRDALVDLWDYVAGSPDELRAAGFNLDRAGAVPIPREAAYGYRDRVLSLARRLAGPDSRVLDIGCGSGLVLRGLVGAVGSCVGIDPSRTAVEGNRRWAAAEGAGARFMTGFADEVTELVSGSFDLILLSSVVQFFPGPSYLERVLADCSRLLAPGGAILVADVIDPLAGHDEGLLRLPTRFFGGVGAGLFGSVEILRRPPGSLPASLAGRYDVILRPDRAAVPATDGLPPVRLETPPVGAEATPVPAGADSAAAIATDPAYCIFTSGSTGVPKGVLVSHRSVVNLIDWVNREFGVDETDRLLLVTSFGFDLSVYDMFGILAAGGSLRVIDDRGLADPDLLLDRLLAEPITFWDSAPAAMAYLLSATAGRERPSRVPALRRVFLSGDWVPLGMPDEVREIFPGAEVIVFGGATEATVWSNAYRVGVVDPTWPSVPYGVPMQNVRYHILNEQLEVCPIGAAGDLYIAGECLSLGYLGDPALTAERFLPEPDGPRPGGRMYRTGDRARWLPDGNVEFLGRLDDQVKLNGYRIELGDVQAAIARHPAVAEAAAVVVRDPRDQLVGFYTSRERALPDPELQSFLATVLPSYLLPQRLVALPALPVSANGKVDREQLARLAAAPPTRTEPEATRRPARTATEQLLTGLVGEVLGRDDVSADDDFFTLGGHSLLAIRLLSRIATVLGRRPSIRVLYEHATIEALARQIDFTETGAPVDAIPPRDHSRPIPLSLPQQRVWYLEKLNPGNLAYNFQATIRLSGQLDVARLTQVLHRIGERHEILRTGYRDAEAVVHDAVRVDLAVADATSVDDPAARTEELIRSFVRRPFNLAEPPLARWLVIRQQHDVHTLVLSEHHLIHDGWSVAVLFNEIVQLYTAAAVGLPDPLPDLPIQYADFAAWQRRKAGDADVSGWLRWLDGAPTVLSLPTDRPRPPQQGTTGGCLRLRLPVALVRKLRGFCRQEGVTLYALMIGSFGLLLSRYSGQSDLLIGTGAARRDRTELEPLIGMMVDTLVVRCRVSGVADFRSLVHRTHRELGEAFSLPPVPLERLVDELVTERDPAYTPLVQVMFSLHDSPMPDLEFAGLRGELEVRHNGSAKDDINIIVIPRGQQRIGRAPSAEDDDIVLLWEFNDAIFDTGTMQAMADHYFGLLEAATDAPGTPPAELVAQLPVAQQAALERWAGGPDVSVPAGVVELVLARVAETPHHPAVVSDEGTLSYAELDLQSRVLADRLRAAGAGDVAPVAILIDRSAALVVAELAALRVGAAFVPLDPSYPPDRIARVLADSGARVLVVGQNTPTPPAGIEVIFLDPFTPVAAADGTGSAAVGGSSGGDVAYVVYTSGSTGRPKGIEVTHANLSNLAVAAAEAQALTRQDRGALVFSSGFDGSLWEIWPALITGATLHVPAPAVRSDPGALARWIAAEGLTVVCLPTPLAEAVLTEPWPADAKLRILGAGGDALRRAPRPEHPFTLLNVYGPTETTVACVVGEVAPGEPARLGRPIRGVRGYVLDDELRPVPPGVPGEIVIGGQAVSRGYLGRPDLTADAFVPDPFIGRPGARMYRTGDRGRWRPDGTLEFLGRMDTQVKINGYRVELGEVVAALRGCAGVVEAEVVARPTRAGGRQLVGYVCGPAATSEHLRGELRRTLPAYMMPAQIVVLPSLPLTAHGKVDHHRLPPPPDPERAERAFNAEEARLAPVWAQVLGITVAHPDEDFFVAGGQSLLAMQLLAEVARHTGREVALADFLATPTLAGLAAALDSAPVLAPTGDGDRAVARRALAVIDEMSDDEVEAMLRNLDPTA